MSGAALMHVTTRLVFVLAILTDAGALLGQLEACI
jgi:hypothetical protein